jgi:hypothetical protein
VTFTDNHDGTATISGRPAAGTFGSYGLTITAHDGFDSDATQDFTLTVIGSNNFVVYGRADGTIWKAGLDGSYDVHIADGYSPRLSPDGRYLVFHDSGLNSGSEFVEDLNTGTITPILVDPSGFNPDENYTWTNDSSQIILDDGGGGWASPFYEVNRDGTFYHQVGFGGQVPAMAPPLYYGYLAYHEKDQGLFTSFGPFSFAGGTLIPNTQAGDVWPTWSPTLPDGEWIAFERGAFNLTYQTTGRNLYKIDPWGGTGLTQLTFATDLTTEGFGPGGDWTADGRYFVTLHTTAAGTGLVLVSADGSGTITPLATSSGAAIDFVGTVDTHASPAFTSGNSATLTAGSNASFGVLSSGYPFPSLSETGAPASVTFTDHSNGYATISAPSASPGTYTFTITAHNGIGSDATQTFTLTVVAPVVPVLTGLGTSSTTEGAPGFTLTVNGSNFVSNSIVQWNGTPLATTFVSDTQLTAAVPTADLAEEGSVSVTVSNPGGGTSSALSFTITDPAVAPTGGMSVTATVGVDSGNRVVATFTDPGGAEPNASDDPGGSIAGHYTATIDWGDPSNGGSTSSSPGTIIFNPSTGVFSVLGSHTYAQAGTYSITVSLSHEGVASSPVTSTATVVYPPDQALFNFSAGTVATENVPFTNQQVAAFSDPDTSDTAAEYQASINWGDGSTSPGTIVPTSNALLNEFKVTGSHNYIEETGYRLTITITDVDNPGNNTTISGQAIVSGVEALALAGTPITGMATAPVTGPVATFNDPDGPNALANGLATEDFTVSIDWGDSTVLDTTGTISGGAGGNYTVSGTHTYAGGGSFPVTVTVSDPDSLVTDTATSTATIQALTATTVSMASDHPTGSVYGDPVIFTAIVSGSPGAGTPTGSVQFQIDGGNVGVLVTLIGGTAALSTATLPAGSHSIVAFYTSNSSAFSNSDSSGRPLDQVVAAAPLTVTARDSTKVYGSPNPAFTASYSGFVLGQGPADLSGTLSFTTSASSTSHVGTYAVTPGGLSSSNYALTFVSGTLTVTPAPLSAAAVSFAATTGVPFTGTVATFINADPFGSINSYNVSIAWGDGSVSAGDIRDLGNGTFQVSSQHTYARQGSELVTVTISHKLGYTTAAAVQGNATVVNLGIGVQRGQSAGIGYWQNKNGQALIDSFNGGPTSTALSSWLAATLPHLYGTNAGSHNLSGLTNAQVAAFYVTLFNQQGPKLNAQVLDTALDVYATTLSLGGTAAQAYGFDVTAYGLGASDYNVGANGAAFGVANNTTLTVFAILEGADRLAVNGVLYNDDSALCKEALNVFSGINEVGGL